MRLKKSFDVDNKLSSYRLSGVEADGADVDSEDGGDVTKEFRLVKSSGLSLLRKVINAFCCVFSP